MPSLGDKAHNGVLYIQYKNIISSSWIFQKLAAEQLQTMQEKRYGPSGKAAWTIHHNTNLTRSGGPLCLVVSLAFGLIGLSHDANRQA
jgi:hypothetical protein